jgi:hypothetical protein
VGTNVQYLESIYVPTTALINSATKIADALALIDAYTLGDVNFHVFRERFQSAHQDAMAGTGPFDELQLLDTLTKSANDWMKYLDSFLEPLRNSPERKNVPLMKLRWEVYDALSKARNPLKVVRNSYPAFDPPPEAMNLDYWDKPKDA